MGYILTILTILLSDLGIKKYIEDHGNINKEKKIAKNLLILRKHHNKGVAMNIGSNKRPIVAMISTFFTFLMTIVFIFTLTTRGKGLLKAGLALILGGAYSNTYDRLKRKYVVDYVSFNVKWKRLQDIIFNIGDFGIIIGAIFLVLSEM